MLYNDYVNKIKKPNPEQIAECEKIFKDYYHDMKKWYSFSNSNGGKTRIFSDYDADGINFALIMKKIFPNSEVYIGDRYKNGYSIAKDVAVNKFDLIIAGDIGASSKDFDTIVNYSKITRIGAFIIDHHELEEEIMCEYPRLLDFKAKSKAEQMKCGIPDYCATGLAYKLYEQHYLETKGIPEKELNTVKVYACLGTVGDSVNINSERDDNREIVKEGFRIIDNAGYDENGELNIDESLAYLLSDRVSEIVSSHELQFNVVPVINACSRVYEDKNGGQFVFDALSSSVDDANCFMGIDEMATANELRKTECRNIYQSEAFKNALNTTDNICILISDKIRKGYTGLVAGELAKQTGKPSICLVDNTDRFEGSGRNVEGYPSMIEMCRVNEAISNPNYKMGGHAMAMGMSIPYDRIDYFKKQLVANYKDVAKTTVEKDFLTENISLEQYRTLEPFGTGMERPMIDATILVKNKNEMGTVTNENGDKVMAKFVDGGLTYTTFSDGDKFKKGDTVKIRGELCDNSYKGNASLQVTISELENTTERQIELDLKNN